MDKSNLDDILERYKAQPVGHGYIDIIVARDNYKGFIRDLVKNGYKVDSVSWWEWCQDSEGASYGLGGPKSIFYEGWFSELSVSVDDVDCAAYSNDEVLMNCIVELIDTKTLSFVGEDITFKDSRWLTPAIWLDVPDQWRNNYIV